MCTNPRNHGPRTAQFEAHWSQKDAPIVHNRRGEVGLLLCASRRKEQGQAPDSGGEEEGEGADRAHQGRAGSAGVAKASGGEK